MSGQHPVKGLSHGGVWGDGDRVRRHPMRDPRGPSRICLLCQGTQDVPLGEDAHQLGAVEDENRARAPREHRAGGVEHDGGRLDRHQFGPHDLANDRHVIPSLLLVVPSLDPNYDHRVKVIVREPTEAFARALSTHQERDRIDPARAVEQHRAFVAALEDAGADVVRLAPQPSLPDACFVSDTILALAPAGEEGASAVVLVPTRPGAPSRRDEVASVLDCARSLVRPDTAIVPIEEPGTLDAGDVILYGDRIAVGLSARTNRAGGEQLARVAERLGYRPFLCPVEDRLHLASAVTALGPRRLVGTPSGFASLDGGDPDTAPEDQVERVILSEDEAAGANVLAIKGRCVMAAGHRSAAETLRDVGEIVVEVELDQFTRADGGPTCLVALIP
jgi:dimethylargininase